MTITAPLPTDWLLPDPEWSVAAGFWEGVADDELRFPRCGSCGRFVWYPEPRCAACGSSDFAWTTVDPHGTVYSFTVLQRSFIPQLDQRIPHGVVLVRFEHVPGVTLISMLAPGEDTETLTCDQPVEIVFESVGDTGRKLPCVRRNAS